MGAEKHLIRGEVTALTAKSEKDIDTLRAVLEECRPRMAETKKDAYDFRRDIVVGSGSGSASESSESGAVGCAVEVGRAAQNGAIAKRRLFSRHRFGAAQNSKRAVFVGDFGAQSRAFEAENEHGKDGAAAQCTEAGPRRAHATHENTAAQFGRTQNAQQKARRRTRKHTQKTRAPKQTAAEQ